MAKLSKPMLARLTEIEQGPSYCCFADIKPQTTKTLLDLKLIETGARSLDGIVMQITDAGRAALAEAEGA